MTNKEAIKIIQTERNHCATHNQDKGMSEEYHKEMESLVNAFDLAIKALMAYRDCRHCTHNIKVGNMRGCELWDCDFEEQRGGAE
jgi:hypothetical protein